MKAKKFFMMAGIALSLTLLPGCSQLENLKNLKAESKTELLDGYKMKYSIKSNDISMDDAVSATIPDNYKVECSIQEEGSIPMTLAKISKMDTSAAVMAHGYVSYVIEENDPKETFQIVGNAVLVGFDLNNFGNNIASTDNMTVLAFVGSDDCYYTIIHKKDTNEFVYITAKNGELSLFNALLEDAVMSFVGEDDFKQLNSVAGGYVETDPFNGAIPDKGDDKAQDGQNDTAGDTSADTDGAGMDDIDKQALDATEDLADNVHEIFNDEEENKDIKDSNSEYYTIEGGALGYEVGKDIPAGKYMIRLREGQLTSSVAGNADEEYKTVHRIMLGWTWVDDGYLTEGDTLELKDGETISISTSGSYDLVAIE